MSTAIASRRLVLVEGDDEVFFLDALSKVLSVENIQIISYKGKDNFRPFLKALVIAPGFADVVSIGVLRDADMNAASALQSVCDAVASVGLEPPEAEMIPGEGTPKMTVMVLPGKGRPGMLEDLCLEAAQEDAAMSCVEDYAKCLASRNIESKNPAKARVQAWLASRSEPGKRLGEAAKAGYLPWNSQAFDDLKSLLVEVCS